MLRASLLALTLLASGPLVAGAQTPAPTAQGATPPPATAPSTALAIEPGSKVQIEYTMTDEAGQLLISNKGEEPLTFTQGESEIVPGLEKQLIGMHTGDIKKVVLKPEDAFGRVDPQAQTEVPKEALPASALVVGAQLIARNAAGESRPVVVKEIKDSTVVLDLNHPLAGKTLVFDVKILAVEPPKTAEPKSGETKPAK